jgi:ammonia channel protein AmtB
VSYGIAAAERAAVLATELQLSLTSTAGLCTACCCSFLVFFMQVGFLSYETGSGRAKNVRNILLKNLLDVMLAAIVWWAVGYGFAYGKSAKGVIG